MKLSAVLFYIKVRYLWHYELYEKAEALCRTYISRYPDIDLVQNLLAETLKRTGKISEAVKAYERLLEMSPKEPMNYLDFIRILFTIDNYSKIITVGEKFLNTSFGGLRQLLKPSIIDDVYWYLAFSYYNMKNFIEARNYFEKIRHIDNWEKKYQISKYIEDCKTKQP